MRKIWVLLVFTFLVIAFIIPSRMQAASPAQGGQELDPYKAYHALDGRFIVDENGVVTDTKTGWVESLSVDGGGWRMPTRDEVKNLYTKGAGTHNMAPSFKTTGGFVWTGETMNSSHAWGFCFISATSTGPAELTRRPLAGLRFVLEDDDGLEYLVLCGAFGKDPDHDIFSWELFFAQYQHLAI
jgi:hypothetical protein